MISGRMSREIIASLPENFHFSNNVMASATASLLMDWMGVPWMRMWRESSRSREPLQLGQLSFEVWLFDFEFPRDS